jgi:hypothetical protein
MVITVNIPDSVNRLLEKRKRDTGMSKSLLIRRILASHFEKGTVQATHKQRGGAQ